MIRMSSTPQLEAALAKLQDAHRNFRLWITAEPHEAFPIGLLQMGIKLTNEAPVGVKAGLRASYQWINQVGDALLAPSVCRTWRIV
jgi:dynein heavy chain